MLSANISNPFYIHYLFEAIVAFVRISSSTPALCSDIENYLIPYMQEVFALPSPHAQYLNRGIIEYMPYIFQVFGLVRSLLPSHADGLLADHRHQPDLRRHAPRHPLRTSLGRKSNQTALVFLLKVYLQKDCNLFLVDDRLQRLFAIFRSLCQRKSSRVDGLELLAHILQNLPMASLQPFLSYCVDILVLLSGVRLLRHCES